MSFKYILVFLLLLGSISCKQEVVTQDDLRSEVDQSTDQLQFALITNDYKPVDQLQFGIEENSSSSSILKVFGIKSQESIDVYSDKSCNTHITTALANKNNTIDIRLNYSSNNVTKLYYIYTDLSNKSGPCSKINKDNERYSSSSTTTLRVLGMIVGESIKIYNDNYCSNEIASTTATKGVVDLNISFVAEDTYPLYYVYTDSTNQSGSCNSTKVSYTYDATAPTAPTITLISNPIDNDSTPSFLFSSYSEGDIIKVFSDASCTIERLTFIGDSNTFASKSLENQINVEGTHSFYYSIEDKAENKLEISSSTCHSIASSSYVYDVTLPDEATSFNFNTITTVSKKLLRTLNTTNISKISIYQEATCTTKLCDSSDSNQLGVCIDNETNENYSQDDYNNFEFKFDDTAANIKNYFFKYTLGGIESNCLKVEHYMLGNTNGNSTPLFTINDQALDDESNFNITVNGVEEYETIYIYSSNTCYSQLGSASVLASATSANINVNFSIANTYDLHYKLKDQAGNYAVVNGDSCISTALTYMYDNGNPADHTQKLLTPFNYLTSDENVEVKKINGNIGTLRFSNLSGASSLSVYAGETCSGTLLSQETIIATAMNTEVNFNSITDGKISYKLDSGTCNEFNFMPTKKDGVESKITIELSGLQKNATLYVYPDTSCGSGDELYTEVITKEDMTVSFNLTKSGAYSFSTKQIDEAGNESNCIVDDGTDALEYTYYKIESVAVGQFHTCATVEDPDDDTLGKLFCWGDNRFSQLGGATSSKMVSIPTLISKDLNATKVSSYNNTSCIIGGTGKDNIHCFGANTFPEFTYDISDSGDADYTIISTEPGSDTVIEVDGIGADSEISFYKGKDCKGTPITSATVTTDPEQFTVDTKNQTSTFISIKSDVTISCDNFEFTKKPVEIEEDYKDISLGSSHACARKSADSMTGNENETACWGDNTYAQIGNGAGAGGDYDTLQNTTSTDDFSYLSAGSFHTCAVNSDSSNAVNCWGRGTQGQLGNEANSNQSFIPAVITIENADEEDEEILKVESGINFSCALATSGKIYCWGANDMDQLAGAKESNGNVTSGTNKPLAIDSTDTYIDLSIADNNACAINSDNKIYCWGSGYDELTLVSDSHKYTAIEVGANHSCALASTGNLYCWGSNHYGQLGNGSTQAKAIPELVDFDFMKTQLHIENSLGKSIGTTIDLKKDEQSNEDLTLYYDNSSFGYKTAAGDSEVSYTFTLTNNSLNEATLDSESISFSEFGDEDYTGNFAIDSNDCDTPLAAGDSCEVTFLFSTTISRPEGMAITLTVIYKDNDYTYKQDIKVIGYSKRVFAGVNILDEEENDLEGSIIFNDDSNEFIATTFNKRFLVEDEMVTIENNTDYPMYLKNYSITGNDKARFSFLTDTSLPNSSDCGTGIIESWDSCTITLSKTPAEMVEVCDEWGDCYEEEPEETLEAYVAVDMFIRKEFYIKNTSSSTLTFTSATIFGPESDQFFLFDEFSGTGEYCSSTLAANSQCKISVYFKPDKIVAAYFNEDEGDTDLEAGIKLSMFMNDELSHVTIPFQAYSNIYEPELVILDDQENQINDSVYQMNSNSTAIAPNTSAITKLITITNNGDSDDPTSTYSGAENISMSIGGDDPTMFSFTGSGYPGGNGTCGTTLAVGSSCTIEIQYYPTTTSSTNGGGVHIGTITIEFENENHQDAVDPVTTDIKGFVDI